MRVILRCRKCSEPTEADDQVDQQRLSFYRWWFDNRKELCRACARVDPTDDRPVDRPDLGAEVEWVTAARNTVRHLAERNEYMTADHLWAAGLPKPEEARLAGQVWRWAQYNKLVEDSGHMTPTTQRGSHGRPVRVWRSLLWSAA